MTRGAPSVIHEERRDAPAHERERRAHPDGAGGGRTYLSARREARRPHPSARVGTTANAPIVRRKLQPGGRGPMRRARLALILMAIGSWGGWLAAPARGADTVPAHAPLAQDQPAQPAATATPQAEPATAEPAAEPAE